ncbi:diphosphate--fructose-6-phosphate 1-phosphotransferase [Paenibacillus rigui]|nr:diphosphate--fructose-6-phosphate 1-phosphotransferase [Paenibacillus rigui]
MHKIAVGQAGGPTAVINASLVGFVDGLPENVELYGVMNGYQGLVLNEMERFDRSSLEWLKQHRGVPGACLGSGRYAFTSDLIVTAVLNLKARDIHTLVFIGGNGTMAALQKMSEAAASMNYELQTIGIPKTVDNDLSATDHAPGYASAAHFVSMSVRDINKDLEAMRNFEQVRIIETMGRNAGWLAMAAGLHKTCDGDGPHMICIPELAVAKEPFVRQVQNIVKDNGIATIVVSEGVAFEGGSQVQREVVNGRAVLGGISTEMEQLLRSELGLNVRSENLGMNQRSAMWAVSSRDHQEAYEVGKQAALYLEKGYSNVMISIQRSDAIGYNYDLKSVPLEQVFILGERMLPETFISNPADFYSWLEPLIGDQVRRYPPAWKRRKPHDLKYHKLEFGRSQ